MIFVWNPMIEIVSHTDTHIITCKYDPKNSRIPLVRSYFTENKMFFVL